MSTKKGIRECPMCGAKALVFKTRAAPVEYKGERTSVDVQAWWCNACNDGIMEGAALVAVERAFIELRAKAQETLLPEQVASVRKQLGISQREASEVLGGGRNAFQRYETGQVPVSEPMKNLLVLLGNDPRRLEEIRRTKAAASTPKKVSPVRARVTPRGSSRTGTASKRSSRAGT